MKKFILGFGLVVFSFCFVTTNVQADFWSNARDGITDKFKRGADDWIDGTTRDVVHDIFGPSQPDGRFELPISGDFNEIGKNTSMRGFILNILNFTLSFLGIIGVAAVVYAGFLYVTSGVDDGNVEKAKNIVIYAVIGILVVLVSYALVNTLIKNAPTGGEDRSGVTPLSTTTGIQYDNLNNATNSSQNIPNGSQYSNISNVTNINNVTNSSEVNLAKLDDFLKTLPAEEAAVYKDLLTNNNTTNNTANTNSFFDAGPILIFVDGEQKIADPVIVPLESAKKGIEFKLAWSDAASAWNFSNGITKVLNPGESTIIRFSQAKNYQIMVIVQTADGQKINLTKTIQIEDVQANFSVSKNTALVNEGVEFSAQGSSTNIGEIIDYSWTCTGGTGCFPNYSGESFIAKFADSGIYEVTLTVETNVGSQNSKMKEVNILKDKPKASFEIYDDKDEAGGVKLDAFDSENVLGEKSGLIYKWNFGDGERQTGGPVMFHKYDEKGSYLIQLIVEENKAGKVLKSDEAIKYAEIDSVLDADFDIIQ
jgi:PKD repeat protein